MADQTVTFYYPGTGTLSLNLSKITTPHSIATVSFYIQKNTIKEASGIEVHMESSHANYYYQDINDLLANDDEWYHISLPVGPYYAMKEAQISTNRLWSQSGIPTWADIDYVAFKYSATGGTSGTVWIDDLRINGIVTRSAYDSTKIGTQKCRMLLVRDDVAKDDTLDSATDTGTIAQFAKAELARAITTPITGQIVIPLRETIQAGQLCHIHFGQTSGGTFRIDSNFRIVEARHILAQNAVTYLTLTDDVKNSYPIQPTDAYQAVLEASHPNFKTRTRSTILTDVVDVDQTVLSQDYNTATW